MASEKVVFLVRHAQSEQNVATARLGRGDVKALGDIIRIGYDAPLSDTGRQQLETAATKLDGFATQHGIEVVVHSPYIRAVETAKTIFAGFIGKPFVELLPLHERTVPEYFFPSMLQARITQVREWLDSRPEGVVALVGHGQFFKHCINAPNVQPNVSIIRTTYSKTTGFVVASDDASPYVFKGFAEPWGSFDKPDPTKS